MSATQSSTIKIWALTDNKPGHRNQLEGLLSALSEYRHIDIKWITVDRHIQGFSNLLTGKNTANTSSDSPPDLLISAGHRTHLQLLALKRSLKKPAVVLMKPSLPLSWFDLCLIPRHDKINQTSNVIQTTGPINRIIPGKQQQADTGLILLGGTSRHFDWNSHSVVQQIQQLVKNNPHCKWQIATSRRTPKDFLTLANTQLNSTNIVTPEQTNKDWLPQNMQRSEQIWVTEDSVSMVYEAITSGAKVGLITLTHNKQNRVTEEMQQLLKEGRVSSLQHPASLSATSLPPLNEARRCAKLLLQRLDLQ